MFYPVLGEKVSHAESWTCLLLKYRVLRTWGGGRVQVTHLSDSSYDDEEETLEIMGILEQCYGGIGRFRLLVCSAQVSIPSSP